MLYWMTEIYTEHYIFTLSIGSNLVPRIKKSHYRVVPNLCVFPRSSFTENSGNASVKRFYQMEMWCIHLINVFNYCLLYYAFHCLQIYQTFPLCYCLWVINYSHLFYMFDSSLIFLSFHFQLFFLLCFFYQLCSLNVQSG